MVAGICLTYLVPVMAKNLKVIEEYPNKRNYLYHYLDTIISYST